MSRLSTRLGLDIVYVEAMACGVTAVGLDVDGVAELSSAEPLGYRVLERAFVAMIPWVHRDPHLRYRSVRTFLYLSPVLETQIDTLSGI